MHLEPGPPQRQFAHCRPCSSGVRPAAEQIVIDTGQLNHGCVALPPIAGDRLNRGIEIEQDAPGAIVADHGLNPEEGGESAAARDGGYMVEAGGGIEDHVAGGELYRLLAELA